MKMRLTQLNDPNYYSSLKNEIKILDDIYDEVRTLSKDLNVTNKFSNNLEELLENLAEDVFFELFKNTNIHKIKLKIEKTQIIKNTSSVGVEITKKKLW